MLPDFLHLGVAKAASTYLWTMCKEHPDVYVPRTFVENGREIQADNPNFFVGSYHRGLRWYEDTFFSGWNGERAVGETSNSYMLFEPALERIARDLPDVKVTLMLRNPIEQAFLQYVMNKRSNFLNTENASFASMLDSHRWQLFRLWLEPGFYASHLKRIYRHFSKDRVFVMIYDDLCADPSAFLRAYFRFLGVDETFTPSGKDAVIGFPGTSGSDTPDGVLAQGIDADYRRELALVFRDDLAEISSMLSRDLSHWS